MVPQSPQPPAPGALARKRPYYPHLKSTIKCIETLMSHLQGLSAHMTQETQETQGLTSWGGRREGIDGSSWAKVRAGSIDKMAHLLSAIVIFVAAFVSLCFMYLFSKHVLSTCQASAPYQLFSGRIPFNTHLNSFSRPVVLKRP